MQPGYWQIPLTERSKQFTAFSIPNGATYQFKVMPFGLKNAPCIFQQLMTQEVLTHIRIAEGLFPKSCPIHSSADLTQWMDDIESLDDDILELDNSPISSPTREKEDAVPPIQEPPINLLSMITVEDVLAEMTPDHLCYQRREFERTYQEYMNLAWI